MNDFLIFFQNQKLTCREIGFGRVDTTFEMNLFFRFITSRGWSSALAVERTLAITIDVETNPDRWPTHWHRNRRQAFVYRGLFQNYQPLLFPSLISIRKRDSSCIVSKQEKREPETTASNSEAKRSKVVTLFGWVTGVF